MGILDKIKGKKGREKKEKKRKGKKEPSRKQGVEAAQVLVGPIVTEKSAGLAERNNQYTFEVRKEAEKPEIKRAIEHVYGVEVQDVRTINIPKKKRRLGKTTGWKKGFKKAIVDIREDQRIEFMSA